MRSGKGCDRLRSLERSGCRPRLSLAPESFAPSAAPNGALSRLSGARGPWCLRDSGGGCSFGAVLRRTLPCGLLSTAGALAMAANEVNALARGVIFELVLRQLEADQMLEGRVRDRLGDPGVRHRIDCGFRFAGLALAGEDLAHVGGKSDRGAV